MTAHAFSLLFGAVLVNQAGVPLPVVPPLKHRRRLIIVFLAVMTAW